MPKSSTRKNGADALKRLVSTILDETYKTWGPGLEDAIRQGLADRRIPVPDEFIEGAKGETVELDAYEVLGVKHDDPTELIHQVYVAKAKYYHPDNKQTGDEGKFVVIKEAWDAIKETRTGSTGKTETVVGKF